MPSTFVHHPRMSGTLDEPQTHNTHSITPPRKRSRQESDCDIDSGIGESEGSNGGGSGSNEGGENGDGRQGGSQKRARSEGHGDSDVTRDSASWSRGVSNYTDPAPLPVNSNTVGTSRYFTSRATMREPSPAESFIPLPVVSLTRDPQMDLDEPNHAGPSNGSVGHTAREDLARSMAFDEQMDVFRRSPAALSSSPSTTGGSALTAEAPVEAHATLEPREPPTSSEEASPESIRGLDASEPGSRLRSEADRPSSSGRLHALADTASMHARIVHAPPGRTARSGAPSLPTDPLPFPSSASSNDTSYPMPPSRLRLFRRQEQARLQPRPVSRSSPPQPDSIEDQEMHSFGPEMTTSRTVSQVADERTLPPRGGLVMPLPSTNGLPLPPITGPPQPHDSSPVYTAPARYRRTLSRNDWFRDMHDPFEPFEPFSPDERQGGRRSPYSPFPTFDTFHDMALPGFDPSSTRRPPGQTMRRLPNANPATTASGSIANQRPFGLRRGPPEALANPNDDNVSPISDPAAIDHSSGIVHAVVGDPEHHNDPTGRPTGGNQLTGSFWTGLFEETDSERDGSSRRHTSIHGRALEEVRRGSTDSEQESPPRRPASIFDVALDGVRRSTDPDRDSLPRRPASVYDVFREDLRRRQTDSERDSPPRRPPSVQDTFRDDLRRRSSIWGSSRHSPGLFETDRYPATASSSSSSPSSLGRSTSRSLLDPTLRLGSGPSTANPRRSLPSALDRERHSETARSRRGSRTSVFPWFDEANMDEENDPLDLQGADPGGWRRRGEDLTPFSSFFSSVESLGRDDDRASLLPPSLRRTSNLRNSQGNGEPSWPRLMPGHAPATDRDPALRSSLRPTNGLESTFDHPAATPQPNSPGSWQGESSVSDPLDLLPRRLTRRHASPGPSDARHRPLSPIPRETDRPNSSFGVGEPVASVTSRSRLRRQVDEARGRPSGGSELPADSMEDIIPESNARGSDPPSPPFGRYTPSPFLPAGQPFQGIDPPPRPVEPRLSSWDVGPRPTVRLSPRWFRPTSPSPFSALLRQDDDSPDAVHSTSTAAPRSQRGTDVPYQPLFERHHVPGPSEHSLVQRRSTSDVDGSQDRTSPVAVSPLRPDIRIEPRPRDQPLQWSPPSPPSPPLRPSNGVPPRGASETFSELVRRRAARAEAQARATRRPPSPDTIFRSTYRLPRPSSQLDEEDAARRRERVARLERHSAALPGRVSTPGTSSAADELSASRREREIARLERHSAALLLERSVATRYSPGVGASRYQDYLASTRADRERMTTFGRRQPSEQGQRDDDAAANATVRARMLERMGRRPFAASSLSPPLPGMFGAPVENGEDSDGSRERQQLHEAIGRRSRDDEDSTRRTLPRMDRTHHIIPRDAMSDETTRNLQRRLRESEAEVGRALRALDQWGELEGSGERDPDPTQSRMHRFGETLRRRRAPPAFNFGGTATDHDSVPGTGSSGTSRQGRRSPSPTSAAARLQTRQARFARAQGRFRDLGADVFGEPRSRSSYTSRLDMLGGSRFTSRYATRSLGDYMRDEDFDASYENLVRLAAAVGEAKPRGTPAHLLAAMPTGFYKDFATPGCETRCPICLDDYKDLDPVLRISDCDHWFHKECLEQWLHGARSCPLCKGVVRGRTRGQKPSPDDAPGPSGSRREDSDDEGPGSGPGGGGPGRTGSPVLTLEELGSYAAGW